MKNYFDFTGQVALVTGCSTGLGLQMAKALASQGCNIVAVARREELLKEICENLKKEYKVEALPLKCDLTDSKMIKEMVQKAYDHFKRIDILINNAGTGGVTPAEQITDEKFEKEIKAGPCASYHAAKGGVINLSRALAAEWAQYKITVNALCPGFFMTPLTKDLLESQPFKEYLKNACPLERYGDEGELDTSTLFLASKYSSYVTGTTVTVDGGYTCI